MLALWYLERPAWEDCSAAAGTEVGEAGRHVWLGKKSAHGCHSSQVALLGCLDDTLRVQGWHSGKCSDR